MNEYPKQFVSELIENMSNPLYNFFLKSKELSSNKTDQDINDLFIMVLDEFYNSKFDADSFQKTYTKLIRSRSAKKRRWITRLQNDIDSLDYNDRNYPFKNFVIQREVLEDDQWNLIYSGKTLEDIIQENLKAAINWSMDKDSFFIDFPAVNSLTEKTLWNSYLSDIAYDAGNNINSLYKGSLSNFFYNFPANFLDHPLFAPKKTKLSVKEISGKLCDDYIYDGENRLRTTFTENLDDNISITSLDAIDIMVIEEFLNHVDENFYDTRAVTVNTSLLAKLLNPKPSAKHYEMIQARCLNLSRINITFYDRNNKEGDSINFFDRVQITHDSNGQRIIVAYFASTLYKTVMEKNIIQITSRSMESLSLNFSKLIYCALQNERISLSSTYLKNNIPLEDSVLEKTYPFSFFLRNVRFDSPRNIKNNVKIVAESLNEFCEKNIAIHSFSISPTNHFSIKYIPLSQDEFDDLTFKSRSADN